MAVNSILRLRNHVVLLLGLALSLSHGLAYSAQAVDMITVVATSGSMESRINNVFKLHAATEAVTRLADHLPDSRRISVIGYGETSPHCDQARTILPLRAHSAEALQQPLSRLRASGRASLTAALNLALHNISNREQTTSIVLLVDSADSCGHDPCALVRSAQQQRLDFTVHVVGLRLDTAATQVLECVTTTTGGQFHNLRNLADMDFVLGQVLFATLSTTAPVLAASYHGDTGRGSLQTPELITTTRTDSTAGAAPAQLSAPANLSMGQSFRVDWSGPNGEWDYITLVRQGAPDSEYGYYVYIREGNPLNLQAPQESGEFELRYVDGMTQRPLARFRVMIR